MSGSASDSLNHHHNHVDSSPDAPSRSHSYSAQNYRSSASGSPRESAFLHPSYDFDDPFPPLPPAPASFSFLDYILNPVSSTAEPNHSLFDSSPRQNTTSSGGQNPSSFTAPPMPPARQRRQPTGFVDLTSDSDPPQRRNHPQSPESGPSAKRRRTDNGASDTARSGNATTVDIEEIDLSDERPSLRDTLEKQRADAVKAQQRPEEKAVTLNSFTCVICMETPSDITATSCGHLFCHTCLMEALIAGESRSAPGEPRRSQCPVCRKNIDRTKQTDIIPLLIKKGLATQPRKKAAAS